MDGYAVLTECKPETQTASGLYVPDNSKKEDNVAILESISNPIPNIEVGNKVVYNRYAAANVSDKIVVKVTDIIAVIKD